LQHLPDLFETVTSNVLFLFLPLFSGRKRDGLGRQRKNLIERRVVGEKRSSHQTLSGFAQSRQIDLEKRGNSIIMIKTQTVSIRDGDQKEIEKDFDHGEVKEKTFCDKAVIDPTEGAFDLSNSVRTKDSFEGHGPYLPVE
jgi:hypothetical protein